MSGSLQSLDKETLTSIRQAMFEGRSATKAELSKELDISFPTISKFLSEMEKNGEVLSVGFDESSGGRRAERYMYNPEYMSGLAIFLESDHVHYQVFNVAGEVKKQGRASTVLTEDGLHLLTTCIEEIIAAHDSKISSIAIGVPGSVNKEQIFYIPDYKQFQNLDLKGYLKNYFSVPVVVENDMNAAVLGFYYYNGMKQNQSLVYLNISKAGQGAGFMINGDVVRGSTFFAGEISFVPVHHKTNLKLMFEKENKSSKQADYDEEQLDAIGRLIASIVAMINPHAVILYRDEMNEEFLSRMKSVSSTYIPEEHLPELLTSDWRQDYLYGLRRLGLHLLMNQQ